MVRYYHHTRIHIVFRMANGQTTATALAVEQKAVHHADTMESKQKATQIQTDNGNITLPKWIPITVIKSTIKEILLAQTVAQQEWTLNFILSPSLVIGQVIVIQDTKGQNIVRYVITR